jgi:ketosteroid isomerase-like protein
MRIPGFKITWESKEAVLSPDGQLGYIFSRNAVTLNAPDGTPVTTDGRGVTIWRHEPDSQWRCAVDIWNAELA